jgi:hypothetical protein
MLGIDDPGIYMGYIFAILGLIACVVYGIINWNKGMETEIEEIEKDLEWEEKDEQTKSEL